MILNLKELSKFIVYRYFKVDSLKRVADLLTKGCFMASADIKDAYFTVSIATEHQKYLKFRWHDKLYNIPVCQTDMSRNAGSGENCDSGEISPRSLTK